MTNFTLIRCAPIHGRVLGASRLAVASCACVHVRYEPMIDDEFDVVSL